MDDIVKQAMVKWPNVPDCRGWLGLDARGNWYLRDDAAQRSGAFASGKAGAKGSRLEHAGLIGFIQRNYACDEKGQWYFQNGPQRVFVELEATPWIWRIDATRQIAAHDGQATEYQRCLMDDNGWVYLQTTLGFGLVHTQDVGQLASAIETLGWTVEEIRREQLPEQFGFVQSPAAAV